MKRVTAVLVTALVVGSGVAGASLSSGAIIGTKRIGAYAVGGTFVQAQRLFGNPYSETQSNDICIARWTSGLTLAWHRKLPASKWSKACRSFAWAKATKAWRTDKGLRVGAAESKIKQLYSHAVRTDFGSQVRWVLNPGASTQLEAWTTRGRVVFLRLKR